MDDDEVRHEDRRPGGGGREQPDEDEEYGGVFPDDGDDDEGADDAEDDDDAEDVDDDADDEWAPLTPRDRPHSAASSSIAAAQNFLSFDDSGHAASYLQMFQSSSKANRLVRPQQQQQKQRFELSFSADRRTRTPPILHQPPPQRRVVVPEQPLLALSSSYHNLHHQTITTTTEDNRRVDPHHHHYYPQEDVDGAVYDDDEDEEEEEDLTSPLVGLQRPAAAFFAPSPSPLLPLTAEALLPPPMLYDDENVAVDRGSLEQQDDDDDDDDSTAEGPVELSSRTKEKTTDEEISFRPHTRCSRGTLSQSTSYHSNNTSSTSQRSNTSSSSSSSTSALHHPIYPTPYMNNNAMIHNNNGNSRSRSRSNDFISVVQRSSHPTTTTTPLSASSTSRLSSPSLSMSSSTTTSSSPAFSYNGTTTTTTRSSRQRTMTEHSVLFGESILHSVSTSLRSVFSFHGDLEYLQRQHETKMRELRGGGLRPHHDFHDDNLMTNGDDAFDFCLVLVPQQVYGFWAQLLDFRVELLGQEVVDAMEAGWEDNKDKNHRISTSSHFLPSSSSSSNEDNDDNNLSILSDVISATSNSMRRRRRKPLGGGGGSSSHGSPQSMSLTKQDAVVPPPATTASKNKAVSVFEKAMEGPAIHQQQTPFRKWGHQPTTTNHHNNNISGCMIGGNNSLQSPLVLRSLYSYGKFTPARSCATGTAAAPTVPTSSITTSVTATQPQQQQSENENNNVLGDAGVDDDIPNPCIARGVAARENRTKGMLPLLHALKRGVVLRHHHPHGVPATFCRLFSLDGGDTIHYVSMEAQEALRWLDQQELGGGPDAIPSDWKRQADHYHNKHHFDNGVSANHGIINCNNNGTTTTANGLRATAPHFYPRRTFKVADVVAVHPARNNDKSGWPGSLTLRRATSTFTAERTFSIVLKKKLSTHTRNSKNPHADRDAWHAGKVGNFKYLDLEAANLATYWKVFRGLLLLHRDATVGRFAKQRAAGLGRRGGGNWTTSKNDHAVVIHEDEFHEPATAGWLERRLVHYYGLDDTYLKGFVTKPDAVPPPSDYFLGFKSPGTAIWSRLRQAGLETKRLYSLDPNRVMIQVRCPVDRLMDVAEVLKIQLKTSGGSFVPFRESMMDAFVPQQQPQSNTHADDSAATPFRSSVRQTIIDFIVGSRIRDSGAELGQRSDLGSLILARVPLHSPRHLNGIFQAWFYFWRPEHWPEIRSSQQIYSLGRRRAKTDRLQLTVPQGDEDDDDEEAGEVDAGFLVDNDESPPPHALKRFIIGCFCQPLDAIEQYFGEKVAFYFTWLQHTAVHLLFLAVPGLIVFICMLYTGNFNHPLRPFFALYVMIWTFIVLLNWKKRANYMAYRWGTMNYQEQETTRPQFKGDFVQDEITGEWIVRYPKWKRWIKYCISFPLTLLFTSGTLFLILWVHANRDVALAKYLTSDEIGAFKDFDRSAIGSKPVLDVKVTREMLLKPQFWFIAVALPAMLGLFLPLLNFILMRLSILLNDFENYRTISEYRTFLIIKVFSFRFVCYFATLYYYAYISTIMTAEERLMDDADELRQARINNGILRVGTGVCVYTTVAQWWQTALQHCFPLLIRRLRMNHRLQRLADELRGVETEEDEIQRLAKAPGTDGSLKQRRIRLINKRLMLDQAQDDVWLELMNPMHDSFPEYIQAVVQFAFVSCFSVVLPITPVLVLFNYLVSMRLDAYKLCKSRRRPLAEKTGGIGVWEHVLHIVAVISVLTNCWLVGFTSSFFVAIGKEIGDLGLFALIVGWEHVMLLIKYAMSSSASTIPTAVRDDMKRQQYEMEQKRSTLMLERRIKSPRVLTTEV